MKMGAGGKVGGTPCLKRDVKDLVNSITSFVVVPDETDVLEREARACKHGVIEVGCWHGRSSVVLGSVAVERGLPFVAVDTWLDCDIKPSGDVYPSWRENMKKAGLFADGSELYPDDSLYSLLYSPFGVHVLRMPSVVAARLFDFLIGARCDLLFIDADHSYESVKEDFMSWLPRLERPATVVLHDVGGGHYGVSKFVEELRASGFEVECTGNIGVVKIA